MQSAKFMKFPTSYLINILVIVIKNGFNQMVLDGKFIAIATGTDASTGNVLRVVSPKLALNAADYNEFKITMSNTETNASTILLLTIKTSAGNVVLSKAVTTTEQTTYTLSLEGVTGTIECFEFTPTNIDCTISIESIAFTK